MKIETISVVFLVVILCGLCFGCIQSSEYKKGYDKGYYEYINDRPTEMGHFLDADSLVRYPNGATSDQLDYARGYIDGSNKAEAEAESARLQR